MAKIGPSSGLTLGSVSKLLVNVKFKHPAPHGGTSLLRRALIIDSDRGPFAVPGDSGAPVFRESDGNLIGMVIAGSYGGRYRNGTVVMLIHDILDALEMDFAT